MSMAQIMPYMSATDSVLVGLPETLRGNPDIDPDHAKSLEECRAVDSLQRAVRHAVIATYPDLD